MFRFMRKTVSHAPSGNAGFLAARVVIAAILLLAATLKLISIEPSASLPSRIASAAIPSAELCLAVWLLSGVNLALSWTICGICFAVFVQVSLFRAISGQQDCGCFGEMKVNPWVTFLLDVAVLAAVLTFYPRRDAKSNSRGNEVGSVRTWTWYLAPLGAAVIALFIFWKVEPLNATRRHLDRRSFDSANRHKPSDRFAMTQTAKQTEPTIVAPKRLALRRWARSILGGKAGTYGLGVACAIAIAGIVVLWACTKAGSFGAALALLKGELGLCNSGWAGVRC